MTFLAGSGVEILVNEPYTDGPGSGDKKSGQYTHKVSLQTPYSPLCPNLGFQCSYGL